MDFSEQVVATSALAGYLPLVRNSGNDWTTSAAPYPGDEGGDLPGLLVAMRGEASLGLNSLRMRVPASEEAHYVTRRVSDALRDAKVLDLTQLCIKEGVFVWKVCVDVYCLDHDGSVLDAALAACVGEGRG